MAKATRTNAAPVQSDPQFINLNGGAGSDNFVGTADGDNINGFAGDDVLDGAGGDDTLRGGTGNDTLIGGLGNDRLFVDSLGDVLVEAVGEGDDQVISTASYILASGVEIERISLADSTGTTALDLTGNEFGQRIDGNNGANTLRGEGGDDLLNGNQGDDVLFGGIGNDDVRGGAGNDTLYGEAGDDILNGGSGNDTLDGDIGDDDMTGGLGDDSYRVDDAGDVVNELAGEGSDTVISSINYTLAAGVSIERLSSSNTSGTGAIDLTGNEFGQRIDGNDGVNTLSGLGGDDELNGRGGDDIVFGGEGTDSLRGNDGDDTLYGENGNDTLTGGQGNDILVGGAGDDAMAGGVGDDDYRVDSQGDTVDERDGEGNDRLITSGSYVLAAGESIERISVSNTPGTAAINVTGNEFGQRIDGNNGDNILNGGAGDDELNGFVGNDTMIGGTGEDDLSGGLGNDTLQGGADDDFLQGGNGNDILDGGTGIDVMRGNLGNDTYYVDSANDVIGEQNGEGFDRVFTSINFDASGLSIERLSAADKDSTDSLFLEGGAQTVQIDGNDGFNILDGTASASSITLNGRGGDDVIGGGNFNDILSGGNGNDAMIGEDGDDVLIGGSGVDVIGVNGTVDDYEIEQLDVDSFSVDGLDGFDTTFGVEYIYFFDSDEWYLLSDMEGGPVAPPPEFDFLDAPLLGGDKAQDDAQVLPGLADEGFDLAVERDMFPFTGETMRAFDALDSGLVVDGLAHDNHWLF